MSLFDFLGITTLFFLLIFIFFLSRYNMFIKKQTQVEEDLSDIDIQLKRRSDLISQLIEVVKGYAKHEKNVFVQVAKLRSQNKTNNSLEQLVQFENKTASLMGTIIAIAENYPALKADKSYQMLMDTMKEVEDKIAFFRGDYNTTVKKFNTSLQTFPNSLAAVILGFKKAEFFIYTS